MIKHSTDRQADRLTIRTLPEVSAALIKHSTDRPAGRLTDRQAGRQADRQTDRQTCRQTDRRYLECLLTDSEHRLHAAMTKPAAVLPRQRHCPPEHQLGPGEGIVHHPHHPVR